MNLTTTGFSPLPTTDEWQLSPYMLEKVTIIEALNSKFHLTSTMSLLCLHKKVWYTYQTNIIFHMKLPLISFKSIPELMVYFILTLAKISIHLLSVRHRSRSCFCIYQKPICGQICPMESPFNSLKSTPEWKVHYLWTLTKISIQ